jgi:hypothetical protein
MDNYKIKVKDEASADEARDLFKKLGYHPDNSSYEPYVGWIAVFEDGSGSFYSHNMNLGECVEITIAQLRDLVVLKRNDINDANWEAEGGDQIFKDSNDKSFIYRSDGWDELLRHEMRQAMWEKPKAIAKPKDPALISGAEALADITKVQHAYDDRDVWYTTQYSTLTIPEILKGETSDGRKINFRLKPQTIKLELEIPAPYKAKIGGRDDTSFVLNVGRHQYCYKTEEDYTKARDALEAVFDAAVRGTNS